METLEKQLKGKAKSFLDLRRDQMKRFKHLSKAQIGDEARKIALETMHFMEDKQWVRVSDVLVEIGDALIVKREEIRDQIIRLMQIRAGSLFNNQFEAGMIYANLKLLGWEPKWRTREEVAKWITDVVYSAHTSEEAETKLNQILKETK